jgi:energy-coupling factor transporter transmembrane protein EcfT
VIEFLLFWLFLLLLVLFVAAFWLVQYILIPGVLLRAFFGSEWAPKGLKEVVGWTLGVFTLLVLGGLGWSWHRQEQVQTAARQQEAAVARMPFIRLTVQQPGLRPYPLGRGRIEVSPHDSTQRLVVSGDLPDGQRLRARFTATRGTLSLFETDVVVVSTDKGMATQAVGHSCYAPDSQTVHGAFRCVLRSGKSLSVSFPPTPVARR